MTIVSRWMAAAISAILISSAPALSAAAGPEGGKLLTIIRFERGAKLGAEAEEALREAAKELEGRTNLALFLIGHTDDRGGSQTNLELGKRRADAVKRWLEINGVSADAVMTGSRGEEEPLEEDDSSRARALNRRVEIWIAERTATIVPKEREPLAWLSWLHHDVSALKPGVTDWSPARVQQPLDRLWRVRTAAGSASEVTFRSEDQIYLGEDALVVIFGEEEKVRRKKISVADVSLEEGSLIARLARKDRSINVTTPASRVAVRSKNARIGYQAKKRANTVAVYEGKADVSAKGKSVEVGSGFGTRVKKGSAPEPATPLPPPPTWSAQDSLISTVDGPAELSWSFADSSTIALVEVYDAADLDTARAMETVRVSGTRVRLDMLPPGTYQVRLRAIDARDLVGDSSGPRGYQLEKKKAPPPPPPPPLPPPPLPPPPPPPPSPPASPPPAPVETPWQVHLSGGVLLGPHDDEVSSYLGLWVGRTVGATGPLTLDLGPHFAWYRAKLVAADGRSAKANVLPIELRASLNLGLGPFHPYLGASGGVQLLLLGGGAKALGLEAPTAQPRWNTFVGAGIDLGPGRFTLEGGFGRVGLARSSVEEKIGGFTILGGYLFEN